MEKNFNLEMFKNGSKVVTRLGHKVKYCTVTSRNELIVFVTPRYGLPTQEKYTIDGKNIKGNSMMDLVMA